MPSALRAFLLVSLPLFAAACGGDDASTAPAPGARLVAISPLTQTLRPDTDTTIEVRYEQEDGTPISGAIVEWEIDGFAAGATLGALETTTDEGGASTVALRAAATGASFVVRATPPLGDPLDFQVAVTDMDAGSIRVDLTYSGATAFDQLEAFLFEGTSCMDLSARSLPTALIAASPVTRITQSPGFVPVDVGTGYVVAVQAKVGTTVSGFGCAGNVAVVANEETRVPVTITDLPELLIVDGVYELDNQLDLGEGLPPSVRVGIDVLAELTDDGDVDGNLAAMDYGEDPGAFVVDFAMRETCHWECMAGEDFDTCSEANHPLGDISAIYLQNFRSWSGAEPAFFGGCGAWEDAVVPAQNLVNGQISMVVPDSVTMFGVIAGDLARAISEARIGSRLTVDQPMDGMSTFIHELIDMTVVVHDLEGMEHTETFDLIEAGLGARPRAEARLAVSGADVTIPAHGFDLDFGLLVRYVYLNVVLPLLDYSSSAEMLTDWIDCDMVGASLASSVGILSAMQYRDACRTGIAAAGTFLDFGVDGVIGAEGVLTLEGEATAASPDAMGFAEMLTGGTWTGGWTEGMSTGDVTGTFSGARL
jgi:hypothetical protein